MTARGWAFGAAALAAFWLLTGAASAESVAEACLAATPSPSVDRPLARVRAALLARQPVLIAAIGSSSTRGVGASSWAATYPEVMQRELMRLKPSARIDIANLGVNGETIRGQIARMERDALSLKPQLVIWQLGSNDVVWPWGGIDARLEGEVVEAVRRVTAAGSDIVLMDLQNSPFVAGASLRDAMLDLTARAARQGGAGLFRRFRLLERAVAAGVPLSQLTSWDQLHNTDAAYDCTGRALARAIHAASR